MARGGYLRRDRARRCIKAIDTIAEVMQPDETRLVETCLQNADVLVQRWTSLTNTVNPGMIRTVSERFKSILSPYLEYLDDPKGFKPRIHDPKHGEQPSAKNKKAKARDTAKNTLDEKMSINDGTRLATPRPSPTHPAESTAPKGDGPVLRTFPLENGRMIEFSLPSDGITVRDAARFFCHLLTLASDWNPLDPAQTRMFSLIKVETKPDEPNGT